MARHAIRTGFVAWLVLLLAPALTVFSASHVWDVAPLAQLAWTAWAFGVLWCLCGPRLFLLLTVPLALFGVMALGADLIRSVNLLELVLVSGGASRDEALSALRPYAAPLAVAAVLLAVWAALLMRDEPVDGAHTRVRRHRWGLAAVLAALAVPLVQWQPMAAIRAWPINLGASAFAAVMGRGDLLSTLLPYAAIDPRIKTATWEARRLRTDPPRREVYVVVIGESVRADRLRACGGPRPVQSAAVPSAVVYCDVMAASSSTHTAVPQLLSREAPGGPARVSRDATMIKAFAETGFRTYWLSVQEPSIAWPDAHDPVYIGGQGTDRQRLMPQLERKLAESYDKKMIVLHAYNAHAAYCDRYSPAAVVAPVDCATLGALPSAATRERWLASYDNALQESMLFLDETIAALAALDAEVFLVFVPDHGENILDDERGLYQHALAFPTRWDTRVPMMFWANDAWRQAHPAQWDQLAANRNSAAMHADMVPTLLGAAGIGYTETRRTVADLTRAAPPKRTRWVLRRLGQVVDGDAL
jgi:glucan phosphoethanolaminetransferase (alkaline phosphatase superfamily)